MDRRESLKALLIGTVSTTLLVDGCEKPSNENGNNKVLPSESELADRMQEEKDYIREIEKKKFFNPEELMTLEILGDIIIPRDSISGSASDAEVTKFIEFIVLDMPQHQTPLRGGIRWLNIQSMKRFNLDFNHVNPAQRMELVDEIAWPEKAKPEMKSGVAFFSLVRNLTATGFYTSEIGVKDIGYLGNQPNLWNGVPNEILKQYNLAYSEKELKECINYDLKKS